MCDIPKKRGGRPSVRPTNETLCRLYIEEGKTATEIAAMYKVKPSTVRSWITKARKEQ
jgi:transposase-like protein